jgi:hypothetical protein
MQVYYKEINEIHSRTTLEEICKFWLQYVEALEINTSGGKLKLGSWDFVPLAEPEPFTPIFRSSRLVTVQSILLIPDASEFYGQYADVEEWLKHMRVV